MSSGEPSFDTLTVPDGTHVQEKHVLTDGDVFIGGGSTVELGVRGRNVAAGERVDFGGDIEAEGDCRLGLLSDVAGDVYAGENAYIGDRAHIRGGLAVAGDLDIGDDVDVDGPLDADGWIVTRTSIPTLVLYFIVLSYYLRLGDTADDGLLDAPEPADTDPLIVPRDAMVTDDFWRVPAPAVVGANCRLHGNIRADAIDIGQDTEVFGGLTADGDVTVEQGAIVHGDVIARTGTAEIQAHAQVRGGIDCRDLIVHESATVEGTLRADREMRLVQNQTDESRDERTTPGPDAHGTVVEPDAVTAEVTEGADDLVEAVDPAADPETVRDELRSILRARLDEKPYNDLKSIAADIDGISGTGGREELTGKIIDAKIRRTTGLVDPADDTAADAGALTPDETTAETADHDPAVEDAEIIDDNTDEEADDTELTAD